MEKTKLTSDRCIGKGEYPFIIAEIGNKIDSLLTGTLPNF
jgi:hypothetical protein